MQKLIWIIAGGGFTGGLLSSWLAPKLISWYFNPPIEMAINCATPIEWALRKLQWAQMVGSVSGAVLFLVLYFAVFRKKTAIGIPPT